MIWTVSLRSDEIEVLQDGRIAVVLHSGKVERPMSTHEVREAFKSAVEVDNIAAKMGMPVTTATVLTRKLVLK